MSYQSRQRHFRVKRLARKFKAIKESQRLTYLKEKHRHASLQQ